MRGLFCFSAIRRRHDPLQVESHLGRTPFIFRKAASSPFLRKLAIAFRDIVNVLAIRHQLEDDHH